jgi:hypothetical protein
MRGSAEVLAPFFLQEKPAPDFMAPSPNERGARSRESLGVLAHLRSAYGMTCVISAFPSGTLTFHSPKRPAATSAVSANRISMLSARDG